jgi:hypothetical protein
MLRKTTGAPDLRVVHGCLPQALARIEPFIPCQIFIARKIESTHAARKEFENTIEFKVSVVVAKSLFVNLHFG